MRTPHHVGSGAPGARREPTFVASSRSDEPFSGLCRREEVVQRPAVDQAGHQRLGPLGRGRLPPSAHAHERLAVSTGERPVPPGLHQLRGAHDSADRGAAGLAAGRRQNRGQLDQGHPVLFAVPASNGRQRCQHCIRAEPVLRGQGRVGSVERRRCQQANHALEPPVPRRPFDGVARLLPSRTPAALIDRGHDSERREEARMVAERLANSGSLSGGLFVHPASLVGAGEPRCRASEGPGRGARRLRVRPAVVRVLLWSLLLRLIAPRRYRAVDVGVLDREGRPFREVAVQVLDVEPPLVVLLPAGVLLARPEELRLARDPGGDAGRAEHAQGAAGLLPVAAGPGIIDQLGRELARQRSGNGLAGFPRWDRRGRALVVGLLAL
jgi:hypothetical protein